MCCNDSAPGTFSSGGKDYLARAPKTFANNNTAWWDASQLYGYDDTSRQRVKRDPKDPAKLLLDPVAGMPGRAICRYSQPGDPIQPQWAGQEAAAFPGQLDDRPELPAQPVRARAQLVCGRVPQGGGSRSRTPTAACAIRRIQRQSHSQSGCNAGRVFRSGAAGGGGGDREDPYHRVDAAAALRRAAVQRHERQLERPAGYGRSGRFESSVATSSRRISENRKTRESDRVVFRFCFGTGYFRAGQQDSALRHYEAGVREWRRQSFRIAVQFP